VGGCASALLSLGKAAPEVLKELNYMQMEQYHLALCALATEIQKPNFKPTDAHIHTVATLVCNHGTSGNFTEPFAHSPMGVLQAVFAFGNFDMTLAHVQAVYDLVRLKGGIDHISTPAMVEILEVYVPRDRPLPIQKKADPPMTDLTSSSPPDSAHVQASHFSEATRTP
jgi:hypothetical protein